VHREALAGDHGLVDFGLAFFHGAVGGDLRAGANQEQVVDLDLGGRDLDGFTRAEHDRHRRGQVQQGADGVVGTASGPHLEPVAEQHECGEHHRGLVEDLAAAGDSDPEGIEPTGADGHGHQHHHVQGPGPQGPPGAVEEDPRGVEDDRQRQDQGEDVVAHAERGGGVEAEHVAPHRRVQRDGYGKQHGDQEPVAHVADHVGHRHLPVTAVTHRVVR
jgi:hypothetical protein